MDATRIWWKRFLKKMRVLSLEWNSECVMEGESGEQVEDELECDIISRVFYARLTE